MRRQIYAFPRAQGGPYADQMERLTLTNQDLGKVRGLLDPSLPCAPDDDIAHGFLEALRELIGCDDCTLQVMDLDRRYIRLQESSDQPVRDPDLDAELEEVFWEGFWDDLACSYPQRTGDTRVTRWSDFTTTHSPVSECEEVLDFPRFEMLVPLPMPVRDGPPTQQRFLLSIRVVRGDRALDDVSPVRHGAVTTGELGEKGTEVGAGGEPG